MQHGNHDENSFGTAQHIFEWSLKHGATQAASTSLANSELVPLSILAISVMHHAWLPRTRFNARKSFKQSYARART